MGKIINIKDMTKPSLLYFDLNGRAIASRLLLKHKGIDFDDKHPEDGKWPELKAEFPQRGGLPWYTDEKGTVYTQSQSILRALAKQHGYASDNAWVQYESDYTIDVLNDAGATPGFIQTFFKGTDATDDERTSTKNAITKALDILDARWADGRKYSAGDQITAADFQLLGTDVGLFSNEGGKNPDFNKAINEEVKKRANVSRVIGQVRGENGLDDYIKGLPKRSL